MDGKPKMMDDDSRILYSENYSHKAFTVSSVIFLTRGAVSTNQRPVFRSRDLSRPIRAQYHYLVDNVLDMFVVQELELDKDI